MICRALADHRLAYLDYEGPIAGDRGSVSRWDWGTYQVLQADDSRWTIELAGEKIKGLVVLQAVPDQAGTWEFMLLVNGQESE
jgi:hypothetical protein